MAPSSCCPPESSALNAAKRASEAPLAALQHPPVASCFVLGLSGGRDSVALLHALHETGLPVQAVHVHHGLQPAADEFAAHCQTVCAALNLPLRIEHVNVQRSAAGLEADARRARYAALEAAVPSGGLLVTAHHAADQAETVLMRILRGTGPEGLAAMRPLRQQSSGISLWRPWLAVRPEDIAVFAESRRLRWVDDPHNADLAFTRVWLRDSLIPQIEARFPGAQMALNRLAALAATTAEANPSGALYEAHVSQSPWGPSLSLAEWGSWSTVQRNAVLREWLRSALGQPPAADVLHRIACEVIDAGPDRQPQLRIAGRVLRRYRQRLYLTAELLPIPTTVWPAGRRECRVPDIGIFTANLPLREPLTVRAPQPGDRIQLARTDHHQRLQTLFQSAGIPPWARGQSAVLSDGEDVLAVADRWRSGAVPNGLTWEWAP